MAAQQSSERQGDWTEQRHHNPRSQMAAIPPLDVIPFSSRCRLFAHIWCDFSHSTANQILI